MSVETSTASKTMSKKSWWRRVRRHERGASLVLVSGSLVAFVAIAALAVDYGQLVSQRRAMVTATDAASLAAATAAANGVTGEIAVCSEALAYMQLNAPEHENFDCRYVPGADGGIVEVSSSRTVSYGFGAVLGMSSGTAASSTAAEFIGAVPIGIRPFILCDKADPTLTAWLTNRDTEISLNLPLTNTVNPTPCDPDGNAPGNWGIGDLDSNSNRAGDTADWIQFGYFGDVHTSDEPGSCAVAPIADPDSCYEGDPGNISGSLDRKPNPVMSNLRDSGELFYIPVFKLAEAQGNIKVRYNRLIVGRLDGFNIKGSPADKFIEFRLFPDDTVVEVDPAVRICGSTVAECP